MHTAIANWAAWWNDGRSKTDLALPYVAVYVDDANVLVMLDQPEQTARQIGAFLTRGE